MLHERFDGTIPPKGQDDDERKNDNNDADRQYKGPIHSALTSPLASFL